ncbi:MAG: hypothetical protein HC881_01985 [Leptolyngbyaceae cyanobacterium SL_7_1]|nr:hypothetical protein [Leptolyngbyaceae cyanobacterium SL_7_1]
MAYQKRQSAILEKALARLRGLESLDPTMDLGSGLSLQGYADLIAASNAKLQTYNLALAEADRTRIEFAEAQSSVSTISSRILSAIVARYGKDSKEYEMAGGKPPSRYKRSRKKSLATSTNQSQSESTSSDSAQLNGSARNGYGELSRSAQS